MADPQVKNLAYQALGASLAQTAANPATSLRQVEMKPTPRSPRMGMFADAMMAVRDFANRLQIPQGVPLIGGEGVGSLLMGRAPEELVEMSYGNMPVRVNPYAGRTAGFMPEMKPGRGAQVADLLSLAGVPGGGRTAAAAMGAADFGSGAERALIGYHGTPHRFAPTPANPLGEFRASQIGTGEGAQAYGYGTYFAENPGVAKGYKTALSGYSADGKRLPSDIGMVVSNYGGDVTAAIADKQGQLDKWLATGADSKNFVVKGLQDEIKKLSALQGKRLESTGSLYTVDIPDEMIGKMLDWDKPLSQQPKSVQSAVFADIDSAIAQTKQALSTASERRAPTTAAELERLQRERARLESLTGGNYYNQLSLGVGSGAPNASESLKQLGIPGIRYLDEGSRGPSGTGRWLLKFKDGTEKTYDYKPNDDVLEMMGATASPTGTRNIVVFPGEESKVKILSRE